MEYENVKLVSEALTGSLESTQEKATETEKLVIQVESMSGKPMHERTVQAILDAPDLSMGEKIDLIHRENTDYDTHEENNTGRVIRMQDTQTENIGKATSWWSQNWGWFVFGGACLFFGATPSGRRIATTMVKQLVA